MIGFSKRNVGVIQTRNVFAAACTAYRLNGNQYIKEDTYTSAEEQAAGKRSMLKNLVLMKMIMMPEETFIHDIERFTQNFSHYANNLVSSDEDYALADKVMEYYKAKTFEIMTNKANEYTKNASNAAYLESIETNNNLVFGIIASLPMAYGRSAKYDQTWERIESLKHDSLRIGVPGDTVTGKFEVLSCIYSKKWMKYFIMAKRVDGCELVSFASYEEKEAGQILHVSSSRVKDYADGNVTRLHYIRFKE